MYEHPIKRAGLTFNRILLSNTRMVAAAFPGADSGKYRLQYKLKFYEAGKKSAESTSTSRTSMRSSPQESDLTHTIMIPAGLRYLFQRKRKTSVALTLYRSHSMLGS